LRIPASPKRAIAADLSLLSYKSTAPPSITSPSTGNGARAASGSPEGTPSQKDAEVRVGPSGPAPVAGKVGRAIPCSSSHIDPTDRVKRPRGTQVTKADRIDQLRARVEHLASPELEGRAPGTPGGLLARRYVEEAFTGLGLMPAGDDDYRQAIPTIGGANLLGTIPGTGPQGDRYILLNAHYDHLGINFGEIYSGADDNASGVAVLLDVARKLADHDGLDRTVLIVSFDAEEPPHFYTPDMGSIYFVAHPTVPLERIDMMLCLDLIGHPIGPPQLPVEVRNSMLVMGTEKTAGIGGIVDGITTPGIWPRRLDNDIFPPLSDHYAFQQVGIPSLFFTVGRDRHYHTPKDTPEKLDYPKLLAFADYLAALVTELAGHADFVYDERAVDDEATLTTLVELGRHAAPLARTQVRVAALVDKLEERLESEAPLGPGDRGTLQAAMQAIEEAFA
jgi:hypothetical protein